MRLWCVAVNAAIDKTYVVPGFRASAEYRVGRALAVAGGKPLNVAKTARLLGVEDVVCTGFVGGRTGAWIRRDLADRGITTDFVEVPGESRENVLIADPTGASETRLLEPGDPVTADAADQLVAHLSDRVHPTDLVVVAGSLRPGLVASLYGRLVSAARVAGARVFLDAEGDALRAGVAEKPELVAPNEEEFIEWTGCRTDALRTLAGRAREAGGGTTVVVKLGPRGALLSGVGRAWFAASPAVRALSTVGSGDALLGGYVAAIAKGESPADALALGVAAGAANTLTPGPGVVDPPTVQGLRAQVVVHAVED